MVFSRIFYSLVPISLYLSFRIPSAILRTSIFALEFELFSCLVTRHVLRVTKFFLDFAYRSGYNAF